MFRLLVLWATCACAAATFYSRDNFMLPYHWPYPNYPPPPVVHPGNMNVGHGPDSGFPEFGGYSGPNYLGLYNILTKMEQYILDKLSSVTTKPPLDSSQRHYSMLMGMILSIAKTFAAVNEDHSYDQVYMDTLDNMAPKVWQDPVSYTNEAVKLIKTAREVTAPARSILSLCVQRGLPDTSCDTMVNFEMQNQPQTYKDEMKSLLTFANVAVQFSTMSKLFENVSNDYNSIHFMIKERKKLKPLINGISKALLILNSKDPKVVPWEASEPKDFNPVQLL